jgi:hypothetical protein
MQQRPDIREFFDEFFNQYLPLNIVEFGTGDGEFIDIISQLIYERTNDIKIFSFDLNRPRIVTNQYVTYYIMDIFDNEKFISGLLGNVILLCDNGDKIREVKTFAKYLKKGDVLMAHDYAYDLESFNKFKFWRTCEITFADIRDSVKEFQPFQQDLMLQAGWLSLIKM